jgi:hypothetical protein
MVSVRFVSDGSLDDVLNGAGRDAVTRRRLALDPNVKIGCARHLLRIDVGSARDGAQYFGHGARSILEDLEVAAEDLHADLGADPRGQHVDAVDDRLRPDFWRNCC